MDLSTGSALEATSVYPARAAVSRDLNCVGCEYNLRTLQVVGRCPECGLNVEQSLLVLPQREQTAAAIKLAAWGLLLSLVLSCLPLLNLAGSVLMLIAAYRLYYRCDLTHMMELGPRVRWLWITTLLGMIGGLLSIIGGFGANNLGFISFAPASKSYWVSTRRGPAGPVTSLTNSDLSGTVELATDSQGRQVVRMLDDSGNVISTSPLTVGQTVTVTSADGQSVNADLDAAGVVTILSRGGAKAQITPGATPAVTTSQVASVGTVLLSFLVVGLMLVDLVSTIFYLLVCRGLAVRADNQQLARRFKALLWLMVIGWGTLVIGAVGMLGMGMAASVGMVVPGLAMAAAAICLLIAVIGVIFGSFKLSSALRRAPQHWSEIAEVPATT